MVSRQAGRMGGRQDGREAGWQGDRMVGRQAGSQGYTDRFHLEVDDLGPNNGSDKRQMTNDQKTANDK